MLEITVRKNKTPESPLPFVARRATPSVFLPARQRRRAEQSFAFQNRGRFLPQISSLDAMKFYP
jgi:hypothetical protein